jgi:hypothetical protein
VLHLPGGAGIASDPVGAVVDIRPDPIELSDEGEAVVATITLPDADVTREVDVATVRLCPGASPCDATGVEATAGGPADDLLTFTVRFRRAEVVAMLAAMEPFTDVALTISGVADGRPFAGSDTVRIVPCTCQDQAEPSTPPPPAGASPSPAASPSPSPEPSASNSIRTSI